MSFAGLRQQLLVLQRRKPRPSLKDADRRKTTSCSGPLWLHAHALSHQFPIRKTIAAPSLATPVSSLARLPIVLLTLQRLDVAWCDLKQQPLQCSALVQTALEFRDQVLGNVGGKTALLQAQEFDAGLKRPADKRDGDLILRPTGGRRYDSARSLGNETTLTWWNAGAGWLKNCAKGEHGFRKCSARKLEKYRTHFICRDAHGFEGPQTGRLVLAMDASIWAR
jgi:hypothetical protein